MDLVFRARDLDSPAMLEPLDNPTIRKFKAAAQHLEPMLKVGKAGLSDGFIKEVEFALTQKELVKIKFAEFKDQKKELAPQLAERTHSHLVMRVGNVMVLHRPRPVVEVSSADSAD
ncbi:MAG: hypothetical protein RLZZ350_1820 [Verrucomicrobiota bacterium]|jgi:RNA-binding protein